MTAIATAENFYHELRERCAANDQTLLPQSALATICGAALRRFNHDHPVRSWGYFLTVASQSQYTGILPSGAYDIIKILWGDSCGCSQMGGTITLPGGISVSYDDWFGTVSGGVSVLKNPAQSAAFKAKLSEFDFWWKGKGWYRDGTVYLAPAPSASGDRVYFEYTQPRYTGVSVDAALETVEEAHVEILMTLAAALVLRSIGLRYRVQGGSVGKTTYRADGSSDRTEADRLEAEYRHMLNRGLSPKVG
jgi:hypothetical protein